VKLALERREALAAGMDVTVSAVFQRGDKEPDLPASLAKEDAATGGQLTAAWKRKEVRGKRAEVTIFHRTDGNGRLVLVGLGPRANYSHEIARRAAAEGLRAVRNRGTRSVGFRLPAFVAEAVTAEAAMRALLDGGGLATYEFQRYRKETEGGVEEVSVHLGEGFAREEAALKRAAEQQSTIIETVLWTREIANLPADTATPERLAEEAQRLGKEVGLKVTVFDETKLAEMHCGGILGVGGGSQHPPRMIVVEYGGGARGGRTIAVVGKGITFDSGGISIKPGLAMSYMKFDKSGACAVLGLLRAAALLKVPPRVIGIMACAENMPSGSAYRPGDVLTTYNGKTIEVINTDAEGRVVLSDALGYAVDKYHPDEIIDLATLTGAEVIALGDDTAAVVTNDDKLAQGILDASAATGEPIWRLPLTDYHRELVKSEIADVRNSTEITVAGVLQGAAFLEAFVGKTPWAHLDIAGPAYTTLTTRKYQPMYQGAGATAFGVRAVVRYLMGAAR
jgi:leucyl aminopeptidase